MRSRLQANQRVSGLVWMVILVVDQDKQTVNQKSEDDLVQDIAESATSEESIQTREAIDRSQSGAPAGGRVVRDLFSTDEIFQRIVAAADEEFSRSMRILFFSGLAAGLSIGLSFMARAALTAAVPSEASSFIGNLLYPIGFIFIIMGHYQLYTENTLSPVTLVLTRIASIPALLYIWGLVLAANVLGATIVALVLAQTGVLEPEAAVVARDIGNHALEVSWGDLFVKGIFAGWLVAGMVWIIHAVRDSITRFISVFLIMYLIPTVGLYHCIVGACEGMYLVFVGDAGLVQVGWSFFLPVLLGNTLGGVLLVALLNYGQTSDRRFPEHAEVDKRLSWEEWIFEYHTGRLTAHSAQKED
ncbi:MAG: formate/nitrite transporter family protein [Chloroflexi bacterium]|nr:formate/nitrite transporter family protein [Chloroflexota bacterium]